MNRVTYLGRTVTSHGDLVRPWPRALGCEWFCALYFTDQRIFCKANRCSFFQLPYYSRLHGIAVFRALCWKFFVCSFVPFLGRNRSRRSALRLLLLVFLCTCVHSGCVALLMVPVFEQVACGESKVCVGRLVCSRIGYRFVNGPVFRFTVFMYIGVYSSCLRSVNRLFVWDLPRVWFHGYSAAAALNDNVFWAVR
jgi:hypothetical protein